jgi:hypothetical protein
VWWLLASPRCCLVDDYVNWYSYTMMLSACLIYYSHHTTSHKCELMMWNFIDDGRQHWHLLNLCKTTTIISSVKYESTGTDIGCRRGTSCCRRGATRSRCRPRHHKQSRHICGTVFIPHTSSLVSVRSGHTDVVILAIRSRPGISKKLTTEEENEGMRIILILFHHGQ